jgi:hypothetical protein
VKGKALVKHYRVLHKPGGPYIIGGSQCNELVRSHALPFLSLLYCSRRTHWHLPDRSPRALLGCLIQEEVIAKYNKEMRLKRPCDGWPYEALFPDQASESATLRVKQEAVNNYVSIAF